MRTKAQKTCGSPEEDRFREALIALSRSRGAHQKDLAEALDVTQGYISKIFTGRQSPKEPLRHKLAEYFGLTYRDMLAIGEREILASRPYPQDGASVSGLLQEESSYGVRRAADAAPANRKDFIAENHFAPPRDASWSYTEVPLREATGSMGGGSLETGSKTISYLSFRTEWIRSKGNPALMSVIRAFGDSMYPAIADGSVVLVDESRKQFVRGKIFYIRMNGQMYIKRLVEIGGEIYVASENDKNMLAVSDADDFEIIGRCIWTGRELE